MKQSTTDIPQSNAPQYHRDNNTLESTRMNENESETSFPEILTREQMIEFDSHDILNRQNNTEMNVIDRRFNEMNRQMGELTDIVLALTQQISSNPREGNGLNAVTTSCNNRSDRAHLVSKSCMFLCYTSRDHLFTGAPTGGLK